MTEIPDGISIHIAAHDADDARALFDKCMQMVATGEQYCGELVWAEPRRGCAQLHTHTRRLKNDLERDLL